jgi:hypothetical protein
MNRQLLALTSGAALLTLTATAFAHHSAAEYGGGQQTSSGTVKEWQWQNPHCFLQLMVDDGKGGLIEAGFEAGSPNTLIRNGFKKATFKPGDKVTVIYGARRDGKPGGGLESVLTAENKWLQWGPLADVKATQEAAARRAAAKQAEGGK